MSRAGAARGVALIGGIVLAALFGPALLGARRGFVGREYVDAYGTQWFYEHVGDALAQGGSLRRATSLFHPWGKDLLLHSGANVLDALLAAPFRAIFGSILGYNIFVVSVWGAGGVAMFRFARELLGDRPAALGAAALFMILPWPLHELSDGRPTQALLVLFVAFLHQMWRSAALPGLRAPLVAGVTLALLGYQYWYYGLFAGLAAAAHGLAAALRPGARARLELLGRYALIAGVALVLTAPVALPLARAAAQGEVPGLLDTARWAGGHTAPLTLAGLGVSLQEWQPWVGWLGLHVGAPGDQERFVPVAALGTIPMGLLLLAWAMRPGPVRRAPVLAMLAVVLLVAPGPVWIVGPWVVPNLPYQAAVEAFPPLQRLWWPARALAILMVLVPIAAGALLAQLHARPRAQVVAFAAIALPFALVAHREGLMPLPSWRPRLEAGYRCLAVAEAGAVAELPWAWSQRHLVAQTIHGHPVLGGMNERDPTFSPPELVALAKTNPLVRALTRVDGFSDASFEAWTEADLAALGALGYRWILFQLDALAPARDQGVLDRLRQSRARAAVEVLRERLGPPVYHDARMMIWAPWGGGSPCEGAEPPPDRATLGRTEAPMMTLDDRAIPLSGQGRLGR